MALHDVRLPDVGEGVAQAELVQWFVGVGDAVTPESVLAEVLTDKASVEISSPVTGVVVYRRGEPGDVLAVGSELVGIELDKDAAVVVPPRTETPPRPEPSLAPPAVERPTPPPAATEPPRPNRDERETSSSVRRPTAAPAVRQAAKERGIDLRLVRGSGPRGRIVRSDLETFVAGGHTTGQRARRDTSITETPMRGLRRTIAERMSQAWSRIPHITYVDEVDLTEIEKLRSTLNTARDRANRLTLLPFVVRALVVARRDHPQVNSTFDDETGMLTTHGAVHVGIATQTPHGLVVPVVRHAEEMSLSQIGAEIARLAESARTGRATRVELSGSTITVSSLGALGGLATTPIINAPEVAIIGVNKMQIRPVWDGSTFVPRTMTNLSSSFDHRVIDGWDAAMFIQRVKQLLELPALLFIDDEAQ